MEPAGRVQVSSFRFRESLTRSDMTQTAAQPDRVAVEMPRQRAVVPVMLLILVALLVSVLTRAEACVATCASADHALVAFSAPSEQGGAEHDTKLAVVDNYEDPGDDQATLVEPIPPMEVPARQLPTSILVAAAPSAHAADPFRPPIL